MKDLLERLRDVDFRVRKEAVVALRDIPEEDSLPLLVEALSDENDAVTREGNTYPEGKRRFSNSTND